MGTDALTARMPRPPLHSKHVKPPARVDFREEFDSFNVWYIVRRDPPCVGNRRYLPFI
jgi:hypothetical protein